MLIKILLTLLRLVAVKFFTQLPIIDHLSNFLPFRGNYFFCLFHFQLAFRVSNFSMVFPYLYLQTGILSFEKMLVSDIINGCGEQFQPFDVAVMDSCLIGADKLKKLAGISAVHVS